MDYSQDNQDQQPDQKDNKEFDLESLLNPKKKKDHILYKYARSQNLVDDLDEETYNALTMKVRSGVDDDQMSMAVWMSTAEDIMRIAKLTREPKNTPLPQSANIKFPLITDAAYQFQARTYPEVVQDGKVVKMDITGTSQNDNLDMVAEVGATHMNYQLLGPDSEWEASMDRLLITYSILGFSLKKTYFDPIKKKNVSDVCNYKDIILRNDSSIQCISDLRRITHILHLHPNDLVTNARAGIYSEDCVDKVMKIYATGLVNPECDLYEQHMFYDLDDDGLEEPYICTVHKQTNTLVRVIARYTEDDLQIEDNKVLNIVPIQYFTDFHFLPSPDGSFMGIGFGTLLLHINETVNTIQNELIDAGKLANLQTGFMDSRIKIMGGQVTTDPGTWMRAKGVIGSTLKDGILPLNYKEPSTVLLQLLGMLVETAKELTSSTDALQGMGPSQNVPATTQLSMIEQGLKRFSAIQKRLYRSLKEEYRKIYRLNSMYADPVEFAEITGNPNVTVKDVYNNKNLRVFPVADPNLSSDAQRMAQSQVVMNMSQLPGMQQAECYIMALKAAKIQHPEKYVNLPAIEKAQQQPNPQLMKVQADSAAAQAENQIKSRQQDLKEKEFAAKLAKIEAEITKMQAQAVDLVAAAKSKQHNDALGSHNAALNTIKAQLDHVSQAHEQMTNTNIANKELQLKAQDQAHQQGMDHANVQLQAHQQLVDQDQGQQQIDQQGEQNDQEASNNSVPTDPNGGGSN